MSRRKPRPPTPAAPVGTSPRPTGLLRVAGAIALLAFAAHARGLGNGFVSWDDPEVLTENLAVRGLSLSHLGWMLGAFHTGNWIPLTWLSHAIVYTLGGLDPRAHHLGNVLLHALNAGLVVLVAHRVLMAGGITPARRAAGLCGALFAVHPLHVESVAWVSERKDLLFLCFYLLALLAYLERRSLLQVGALFTLSLLGKPMAVSLPLVLLLLDVWPLRRLSRAALTEKLPLLAVAALAALVALRAQASQGALTEALPLGFRIGNAARSLLFYLAKLALPTGLVPLYPMGRPRLGVEHLLAALALLALALGAGALRRRGHRALPVGLAFYLVTLLPVLGLVQVGGQAAADRYTYLPALAIHLALSVALARLVPERTRFAAASGAILLALALATWAQTGLWRDSITLWERVTAAFPDVSQPAHTNLANAYRKARRLPEAVREYRRALAIGPPHAFTHDGLGTALLDLGQAEAAVEAFETAARLDPAYAAVQRNLWFAYRQQGRPRDAQRAIERAVELDPRFAAAWSNLGISHAEAGRLPESAAAFERAVRLDPDSPDFQANLATSYLGLGRIAEAIDLYRRAINRNPAAAAYRVNLGNALLRAGDRPGARAEAEAARALGGRLPPPLAELLDREAPGPLSTAP